MLSYLIGETDFYLNFIPLVTCIKFKFLLQLSHFTFLLINVDLVPFYQFQSVIDSMELSETINRETMKIVATKPTTSFEYLSKNLIKYLPNVPQIVLELALSALGSFSRTWFERSP